MLMNNYYNEDQIICMRDTNDLCLNRNCLNKPYTQIYLKVCMFNSLVIWYLK